MDLDIDSLIIRPGMFVVGPDKRYRVTGQEEPEGKKLDIFKDKELAHSVYQGICNVPQQRCRSDFRCRDSSRSR